jgi:superfamily II DNA/RNA helicase
MRNPVKISVTPEQLTLEGIKQYYIALEDDKEKYDNLKKLYSFISLSQCIIYCNSVKRVSDLYDAMKEDNFPVSAIHSSMDKSERDIAFNEFRSGKARVLISSNVTARGIDIQQVSIVINFDIPRDIHTYIHRIGRTGRADKKGVAISFITEKDLPSQEAIEALMQYQIPVKALPENLVLSTELTEDELPKSNVRVFIPKLPKKDENAGPAFHEKSAKNTRTNQKVRYKDKMQAKYGKPKKRAPKK